jgi:hypothetical protein
MTNDLLTGFGIFAGGFAAMSAAVVALSSPPSGERSAPPPPPTEPTPPPRPIGHQRQMVERQRARLAQQAAPASAPHAQHGPATPQWQQEQSQHTVTDEAGGFVAWLYDCLYVPDQPDVQDRISFAALIGNYYEYCNHRQFPAFQTDDFARSIIVNAPSARYGYDTQSGDMLGAKFR